MISQGLNISQAVGVAILLGGVGNGDGTLMTVTFEVLDVKASTVSVSGYLVAPNGLRYLPTFESAKVIVPLLGDVNRDGVVNILDLVQVASKFGQRVSGDPADINEDGVVNVVDLVKVAGALGDGAAAPSVWDLSPGVIPTRADVQRWLSEAQQLKLTDATSQRGHSLLRKSLSTIDTERDSIVGKLSKSVQPRNVDTLPVSRGCGCEYFHLCRQWTVGADVSIRTSTCRFL